MRNKLTDKDRLLHILDAIKSIEEFTRNITYRDYNEDYKLKIETILEEL